MMNSRKNANSKKSILKICLVILSSYILLAVLSVLLAQLFSVNNGKAGILFTSFDTPAAQDVKQKFLKSQSILLKPPFIFSYSLANVANVDKMLESQKNNQDSYSEAAVAEYENKVKSLGYCTIGGEYGSWQATVVAYTAFGIPIRVHLTCNDGLGN